MHAGFGRIESEFRLHGLERGTSEESCECTLGDGAAEIKLETGNGDIRLRKLKIH